jgi:hypothetical protein
MAPLPLHPIVSTPYLPNLFVANVDPIDVNVHVNMNAMLVNMNGMLVIANVHQPVIDTRLLNVSM